MAGGSFTAMANATAGCRSLLYCIAAPEGAARQCCSTGVYFVYETIIISPAYMVLLSRLLISFISSTLVLYSAAIE